jgi:hypothetical protein
LQLVRGKVSASLETRPKLIACVPKCKCRSFDSAEVRFAQDDRSFCDESFRA